MNGYLVVLRHGFDDLPLFLTESEAQAITVANGTLEDDGAHIKKMLSIDCDTAASVYIYEFKNGCMSAARKIKDFETATA